jgi:hypothetical protein
VLGYEKRQHLPSHIQEIIKLKVFPEKAHDVESRDGTKFRTSASYNVEVGGINGTHCPDV